MLNMSLRLTCLFGALLLTTLVSCLFCAPAEAQTTAESGTVRQLGLGAFWSPSPYRNYDNKPLPLPMIHYQGESFYVQGASLGYRFSKTDEDELSIVVAPFWRRFRHADTQDPQLRLLSDRDISGMAGVAWRHHADWGTFKASAEKELTGHGGGGLFEASYSYSLSMGSMRITPVVGAAYTTGALNEYYYGVSTAESVRSELPGYRPGGGTAPYFGIGATLPLSRSWLLNAGWNYSVLPEAIKNSPMVDASHMQSYFIALSRLF